MGRRVRPAVSSGDRVISNRKIFESGVVQLTTKNGIAEDNENEERLGKRSSHGTRAAGGITNRYQNQPENTRSGPGIRAARACWLRVADEELMSLRVSPAEEEAGAEVEFRGGRREA